MTSLWCHTTSSSLGLLRVCWTRTGVRAVGLADDLDGPLPSCATGEDGPGRHPWVAEIRALADGEVRDLDLPLDLEGTPFQQAVWAALRALPWGTTTTYGELALAIGRPRALRAVGAACAANPAALVVPCHRVVRRDGELGGYRWGLDRKRLLLAREHPAPELPLPSPAPPLELRTRRVTASWRPRSR